MKFSMLINVRGQTIISVLTFNSVIITTSECLKQELSIFFRLLADISSCNSSWLPCVAIENAF